LCGIRLDKEQSLKNLSVILQDDDFRQRLKSLAIPVALQNLINFAVSAADTVMLSHVSETSFAGAAAANQFSFVYMVITFGLASGCAVLSAQYWGGGDKGKVRDIFAFMYRLVLALTLIFAGVSLLFPHRILSILTDEQAVIDAGAAYLRVMGIGYLFWGFTNATVGMLRSTGTVNVAIVAFGASLVVSVSLNFVLIFGHLGFPALGVQGAAIGTTIARAVEFTIFAVYLLRMEKKIGLRLNHLLGRPKGIGRRYMRHGFPVLINEIFWVSSHFVLGMIIGRMGQAFLAANAIGGLLNQLVGIMIFGFSSASGVIIGNTIGRGEYDNAKQYAKSMMVLSVLLGLIAFLVVQGMRLPLIHLHNPTPETREIALQLTHAVSIIVFFMAITHVSMMGTLRGGGDTTFVMIIDAIFPWLIAIPLGYFAALQWSLSVFVVFLILRSEDIFKALVIIWRIPSGRWLKDVTDGGRG